jgi:hypothetical protein
VGTCHESAGDVLKISRLLHPAHNRTGQNQKRNLRGSFEKPNVSNIDEDSGLGSSGSGPTTCRKSIHHVSGENELQGRETRPFQKPFHYVCVTIMQHKVRNLHLLCTPAPAPQVGRGESEMQTRPGLTRLLLDRNMTHLAIASDGRQKGKQGAVPSLFGCRPRDWPAGLCLGPGCLFGERLSPAS